MNRFSIYIALLAAVMITLATAADGPVQAQEDIATVLARSAAKSFLITLTRPGLSSTMKFYSMDSLDVESLVAELGPVTGYTLTRTEWLQAGQSFEVEARLQPGNRPVVLHTVKHNGRWRVESFEVTTPTPVSSSITTAIIPTAGSLQPVIGNGSGKLAFQTRNGGDIYLINADGTGLQRITRGIDPQLSPDGSKIAFTRWENGFELFTINVDGSNETTWFTNKVKMKSPTWSADGSRLVFSHLVFLDPGGFKEFYPSTTVIRALRRGETDFNIPRIPSNARGISVDENGLVEYSIPPDARWHLAQINVNTNEYSDLATGSSYNYAPNWHPTDPNTILVRGDKGLFSYNTATQSGQPISFDGNDRGPVVLSPDGTKLALSYWQDGHWEIHTMNSDGSNRQRLTETPLRVIANNVRSNVTITPEGYRTLSGASSGNQTNPHWNNGAPVWSPDSSQIAFLTDRSGKWEVWIMNADGSGQRPMFTNGALEQLDLEFAGVDERMLSWR